MWVVGLLLLVPCQTVESKDFTKEAQLAAVRATVQVVCRQQEQDGSGVIIGQTKQYVYVLTAYHVVGPRGGVEVRTFSANAEGKPEQIAGSVDVMARSPKCDLALLRVETTAKMPGVLRLCPAAQEPKGKNIAALSVGCGGGRPPQCQVEEVAGRVEVRKLPGKAGVNGDFWMVTGRPAQGRSGGPLVDTRGQVLGVCSGTDGTRGYYSHRTAVEDFLRGVKTADGDPEYKSLYEHANK